MTEPEILFFEEDKRIPNSALPVLLYRDVFPPRDHLATHLESLFGANGWTNSWRAGLYDYHHFHSTAHEVLGIARGTVTAIIGGEHGQAIEMKPGDVIVLPAGTGHKCEESSKDILIVGAYAGGRTWDLKTGKVEERDEVMRNIARVPLPDSDPVTGKSGVLTQKWRRTSAA
jgi:uncharacterized protein YjlB